MTLQASYPHIEVPPGEEARLSRAPRIRVAQIALDHLAYGWSADEICRQHPNLTLAEVHAALTYYFDHQAEMEARIKAEWAEAEKSREAAPPSPFRLRMRSQGAH